MTQLCEKHSKHLCDQITGWGVGYMVPKTLEDRHKRARMSGGVTKLSNVDPLRVAVQVLDVLLEDNFFYDEDDDDDLHCPICYFEAEDLLDLAANAAASKVKKLRGPVN